jgi:hypothetical protein
MMRNFALGIGIFLGIWGLTLMVCDSYQRRPRILENNVTTAAQVVKPEHWKGWAFLAGGVVVSLYSMTLGKKSS